MDRIPEGGAMTNTRLSDLNTHLFASLDRLADKTLLPEQLTAEVARANAIVNTADAITDNARTILAAAKLYADHGDKMLPHLPQIGGPK